MFTYFLSYNHKKGVFVNTLYVYIQNNFASSLQIQLKETFSLNMYSTFAVGKKTIDSPYEKLSIQIGKTSEDDIDIDIKYCGFCHTDANLVHNCWGISNYLPNCSRS